MPRRDQRHATKGKRSPLIEAAVSNYVGAMELVCIFCNTRKKTSVAKES